MKLHTGPSVRVSSDRFRLREVIGGTTRIGRVIGDAEVDTRFLRNFLIWVKSMEIANKKASWSALRAGSKSAMQSSFVVACVERCERC